MLPKPMQNPSDLKQNQYLTHQNHNETYEESIRTSTKSVPNPSESQQNYAESTRIPTTPMQNPSELQQKFIRISAQSMQNPFISIKHTRPQPPEQQNPSHVLQPAPECRPYEPESPDSLGRSHMSYILKKKETERYRDKNHQSNQYKMAQHKSSSSF